MRILFVTADPCPELVGEIRRLGHVVTVEAGLAQASQLLAQGEVEVLVVESTRLAAEPRCLEPLRASDARVVQVLGLAAAMTDEHLEPLLAAGVDEYLVAPYAPAEVRARLKLLEQRRATAEQHQEQVRLLLGEVGRLADIIHLQSDIMQAGLDLQRVMRRICEQARSLCGAEGAAVGVLEGSELAYHVAVGSVADKQGFRLPVERSLTGATVLRGAVLRTGDTETDPRVNREATRKLGVRSMITVPLRIKEQVAGVLNILSPRPQAFERQHLKTMELLAGMLGAAMTNAAEYEAKQALVAEHKAALTALQQSQARLVLSDRLVAMGTLAAGVAHEINNPLMFVISNLDFLATELRAVAPELPKGRLREVEEALHEAMMGTDRVRQIVGDLRLFSRADDEVPTAVNLQNVLESALTIARAELRTRARVVRDYAEVPPVEGSEGRFGQVFLNLLINAAQSIPMGKPDSNEIRVRLRAEPDSVTVEVRDTGAGIPPEMRSRIFEPFFTTKPTGEGTGLGLFVCQGIVTRFGGEISVESEVGQGSTFRVTFPTSRGSRSAFARS